MGQSRRRRNLGSNPERRKYVLLGVLVVLAVIGGASLALVPRTPPEAQSHYVDPVPEAKAVVVAVIGDSYSAGSGMGGRGPAGWPALVTEQSVGTEHPMNLVVGAEGASGYSKPGHNGTDFLGEVPKVVKPGTRLTVVFGSRNDTEHLDALPGDVEKVLAAVMAHDPGTHLLVIGPAWPVGEPPAEVLQARDIIRAGAQKAHAVWVDPIEEQWLVGKPELMGEDNIHPNDAGHAYLAEKIGPLITAQIDPQPPCMTIAPFGHKQVNCP